MFARDESRNVSVYLFAEAVMPLKAPFQRGDTTT